jgi:8-oxo-dGTP pyrophosphatase MutT (NUDIX family)
MTATHAGAVAYRSGGTRREYLVVTSSSGAAWVLPKAHLEDGEAPADAALRELREEAGVELEAHRARLPDVRRP